MIKAVRLNSPLHVFSKSEISEWLKLGSIRLVNIRNGVPIGTYTVVTPDGEVYDECRPLSMLYQEKIGSGISAVLEVNSVVVIGVLSNREAVILGCIGIQDVDGNLINRDPQARQKLLEGDIFIQHRQGQGIRLSNSGTISASIGDNQGVDISKTAGLSIIMPQVEIHTENHYSKCGIEPLVETNAALSKLPLPARTRYVFFSRRSTPKSPFTDIRLGDLSETGAGNPAIDPSGIFCANWNDRASLGVDGLGRVDIQGGATTTNPFPDPQAARSPLDISTQSSATSRIQMGGGSKAGVLTIAAGSTQASIAVEQTATAPGTVQITGDLEVIVGDLNQPTSRIQANSIMIVSGGTITINAAGNITISGGSIRIQASGSISLDAPTIALAGGGRGIARIGDAVQAGPFTGTIIAGSTSATCGG